MSTLKASHTQSEAMNSKSRNTDYIFYNPFTLRRNIVSHFMHYFYSGFVPWSFLTYIDLDLPSLYCLT